MAQIGQTRCQHAAYPSPPGGQGTLQPSCLHEQMMVRRSPEEPVTARERAGNGQLSAPSVTTPSTTTPGTLEGMSSRASTSGTGSCGRCHSKGRVPVISRPRESSAFAGAAVMTARLNGNASHRPSRRSASGDKAPEADLGNCVIGRLALACAGSGSPPRQSVTDKDRRAAAQSPWRGRHRDVAAVVLPATSVRSST